MERVAIRGVSMYCEFCKRQLVGFSNGSMVAFGQTEIFGSGEGYTDADGNDHPPTELVVTSALCLRLSCKTKRAIRSTGRSMRETINSRRRK